MSINDNTNNAIRSKDPAIRVSFDTTEKRIARDEAITAYDNRIITPEEKQRRAALLARIEMLKQKSAPTEIMNDE